MFNQFLNKLENTINAGINNVKMIVNNLNENRPIFTIQNKKYYLDNLIAEGGYALIYKIQSVADNKFYALKKITIQSSSHKKQINREIKIWKELSKFGNIVELIDFQWGEKHAYIIMELCEEGTLLDYVNNYEGNIPEMEALLIFNQILLGVNSMHGQNPPIAHRDLKIENILKKKRNFKICDFGSASTETFDPKISDEFVKEENFSNFEKHSTLYYRAPEMCDRYGEYIVNEKVDIWALGCVLYTMVFKEQPFINAQKLEIINANYNFPKDEQKLYSEKFLDLIRVMLTPNPNDRPSVLQIMEWTNYWKETEKIPLSPEVEKIKEKQVASGGIKNQSRKKKLLTAEEIEKIQNKLKKKENEKKKKNYDEINEIFGFGKSKDDEEEDEKEINTNNNNKGSNLNDDLFAVFSGGAMNQNNNSNNNQIKNEKKDEDNLLDMQFYEVDETKQENKNQNNSKNNTNFGGLEDIFSNIPNKDNNTNNTKKEENKDNPINLLFDNTPKETKKEESKATASINTDLFDFGSPENTVSNNNLNTQKDMTFQMNGQDFFSNFPNNVPKKKEEPKKEEVDLLADFNQPQSKPKEENDKKNNTSNKLEDDLFAAFNQTQKQESNIKEEKKDKKNNNNLEDDLFAAFNQPVNDKKEEKEEKKENKQKLEDDLFAAFNQPKENDKKEEKKEELKKENNNNDNLLEGLFSHPSNQNTVNKPLEEKKEDKSTSNIDFDLFNFSENKKSEEKSEKQNNTDNNLNFVFGFGNTTEEGDNGIIKENGQIKSNEINNNMNTQSEKNNNSGQDIFAFFQ